MIQKPPWIQFSILWPFVSNHRLLRRENFYSHITSFTQEFTFLFNVFIRPSKKFNDCSFLSIFVVTWLVNMSILPNKICWFNSNLEVFTISISYFNNEWYSFFMWARVNLIRAGRDESFIIPVILNCFDAVMLSAVGIDSSRLSSRLVYNLVVAHYSS